MVIYRFYNSFSQDSINNGDVSIVLNPEVAYEFDKRNISYSILESYYSEQELLKHQSLFVELEEYICRSFYDILNGNKLDLKPDDYLIYMYHVKTKFEYIFLRKVIYESFFKQIKPDLIRYYSAEEDIDAWLLKYFSKQAEIDFKHTKVSVINHMKKTKYRWRISLSNIIAAIKNRIVFPLQVACRNSINKKGNVLFLSDSYNLKELIREEQSKRKKIWFYNNRADFIQLSQLLSFRKYKMASSGKRKKISIDSRSVKQKCNDIGVKLGLNDIELIEQALNEIINNDVLGTLSVYEDMKNKKTLLNKFAAVVSPFYVSAPFLPFYLYFYKHNKATRRIILLHGDSPFDSNLWKYSELLFSDEVVCEQTGTDNLLQRTAEGNNLNVFIKRKKILFSQFRNFKIKHGAKKKIIYLPTFFMLNERRLDGAQYPDVFYYKLQKKIIDSFINEKSFVFIWKSLREIKRGGFLDKCIMGLNLPNIKYSFVSLFDELPDSYALITDYPSTGMYQAAVAGIPVFGVYPSWFDMNPDALSFWGKNLMPYNKEREAVSYIKKFIHSKNIKDYCRKF
ncbi:MAG: hypothetical protein HY811_02060 [Planctomycetes bacterium]|nr:hypothetical protein [Planctomycetota bacterium]